ncbi:hypothetical protein RIMD111065_33200 [Aeromonas hydrophila]|nr:hypothetical protein RIMD111065_33200 [Aeromonas hydrophila]
MVKNVDLMFLFLFSLHSVHVAAYEYDAKKWTNVSIYSSGGYSSWYEAEWYDQKLGVVRSKKSGTNTAGYTHEFEFPPHARDIRVKGYAVTGLVWQPNKLIFDKNIGYGDNFDKIDAFSEGQYFKIKVWGTTLSPSWSQVSASVAGLDPYGANANECSYIDVNYNGDYVSLVSPVRYEIKTINKCRFTVKLRAYTDNAGVDYILKPGKSATHYEFSYPYRQTQRMAIGNRDRVVVFEHGDFGGEKYSFDSSQPKLPDSVSGKLSSYAIPSGWKVRFYESENYRGRSWSRDSNSSDHKFTQDFNDVVRSIEVLEQP